jgi:predicted ribosome quality control (RQC) complex YloA/Tae2 family protein
MEISSLEIGLLTKRISAAIAGYFVSTVYSIDGGVLIRFNHATMPEKLVAVSSFATWLTTKNLSLPEATKFTTRLRDRIERSKVVALEQMGNERIVRFRFETRKGQEMNLYAEFFSHGNLVLTDVQANDAILEARNVQTFRHRKIVPGERYELPPSRGLALQDVNQENLSRAYEDSIKLNEKSLSAIRWFGRTVGTSRKFVEEVFAKSRIDPDVTLVSLDRESLTRLAKSCEELLSDLNESIGGHILMPYESSNIDADVCPIIPSSWKSIVEAKSARIISYASLSEALDEVQIQVLVLTRRRKASAEARAKSEELDSAIAKQNSTIEWNDNLSKNLRELANSIMSGEYLEIDKNVIEILKSHNLLEVPMESPTQLRFVTEPRSFLNSYTPSSLASRLYDESKHLEEANKKIRQAMSQLENQRRVLLEQSKSQEERAGRKIITERRERQWYERYRWFMLSDGRLIVGGRDATSNSIMINKYTESSDIVFHADLHGSPFFILRNRDGESKPPSDEIALEIAQATVSFSRAWKDELGSADAYWVFGEQVKKSAPSGEYLARGSFFIEGKKNFIRHVKTELAIGLTNRLPLREGSLSNKNLEQLTVICGPDKSISVHCIARLKILPGKEKPSEFAKKAKQQLIRGISDQKMREIAMKISIDEIIRVLPPGGCRMSAQK